MAGFVQLVYRFKRLLEGDRAVGNVEVKHTNFALSEGVERELKRRLQLIGFMVPRDYRIDFGVDAHALEVELSDKLR